MTEEAMGLRSIAPGEAPWQLLFFSSSTHLNSLIWTEP